MVIVHHLPYSPDLAPCDFAFLFPNLKVKLTGRLFETDIKKTDGIVINVLKETILKEMAARIE
jgi:hypothetical protein